MNKLLLVFLFGAQALLAGLPAAAAAAARPNIVVLVADDWGFTDVGAYGGEIATHNIDALARHGVKFSNFHTTASCSPTRSILLTGVDNHLNGVGNMLETIPISHLGQPGYLGALNHDVVTVASLLQESGYRTYAVGKWHVGKQPYNLPDQRGFDHSLIQADSGSDNWDPHKIYMDLYDKVAWFEDGKPAVMPNDYYSSKYYVDKTIGYIDADTRRNEPFFAYVAFQANHIPVQAPREFIDHYRGVYKDGWTALREARRKRAIALKMIPRDAPMVAMATTTDWNALSQEQKNYQARRMEVYAGMAEAMDHYVGRLIDHLKTIGQYDNTVFVFLSDNGPEPSDPYAITVGRWWLAMHYNSGIDQLGAKGAMSIIGPSWSSAAASPLNTYKFYAGEGGIRVPLVISGIPGMRENAIEPGFAQVSDIVPTLLDLAHVKPPGSSWHGKPVHLLTGRSLVPVLTGEATRTHPADEVIGYELSGNKAIFRGDLKLLQNIPPVGDGLWHLYDIRKDPGETADLQKQLPTEFSAMKADYAAYAKSVGVLSMPGGYEPVRQVLINTVWQAYIPRYGFWVLGALGVLTLLVGFVIVRRRRRNRAK